MWRERVIRILREKFVEVIIRKGKLFEGGKLGEGGESFYGESGEVELAEFDEGGEEVAVEGCRETIHSEIWIRSKK